MFLLIFAHMKSLCTLTLMLYACVGMSAQQVKVQEFIATAPTDSLPEVLTSPLKTSHTFDFSARRLTTTLHAAAPSGVDMDCLADFDEFNRLVSYKESGTELPLTFQYEPSVRAVPTEVYGQHSLTRATQQNLRADNGRTVLHFTAGDSLAVVSHGPYNDLLWAERFTDEDSLFTERFYNRSGRLVLERQGKTGCSEVLDTYFVYDNTERLACILPPEAAHRLAVPATYALTACEMLQNFSYFFRYDSHNRLIAQKAPALEWTRFVRDADGRVVLSQSPLQADKGTWSAWLYDAATRLCLTGLLHTSLPADSLSLLLLHNAPVAQPALSAPFGYETNLPLFDSIVVEQVFFYDSYDFLSLPLFDTLATALPDSATSARGLQTGSYTAVIGDASAGETVLYAYDTRARLAYSASHNNVSQLSTSKHTQFDFLNRPIGAQSHLALPNDTLASSYQYTFDEAGRLCNVNLTIRHRQRTDSLSVFSAQYDDCGRLADYTSIAQANPTTLSYRPNGLLDGISSPLFAQRLFYDDDTPSTPLYNGRISALQTATPADTALATVGYDNFARLTHDSIAAKQGSVAERFAYDRMGNVTQLQRNIPYADSLRFQPRITGNRFTATPDTILYDNNGNTTHAPFLNLDYAVYNHLNLPDTIVSTSGLTASFHYLADGRLLGHTVMGSGDTMLRDGGAIIADGRFRSLFIPQGLIAFNTDTTIIPYAYITDYQGSIRLVVNTKSGDIAQAIAYTPSGYIYSELSPDIQPYKYGAKELLSDLALPIYDSAARLQQSLFPRFLSPDPLALLCPSVSPYAFCHNDPVNFIDPTGMFDEWGEAYFASLIHPGSFVGQDWRTGKYFYSYYVEHIGNEGGVAVHREFGPDGNVYGGHAKNSFNGASLHSNTTQTYLDRRYEENLGKASNILRETTHKIFDFAETEFNSLSKNMYNPETGNWTATTKNGITKTFNQNFHGNQYTPSQKSVVQTAKRLTKIGKVVKVADVIITCEQIGTDFIQGNIEKGLVRGGVAITKGAIIGAVSVSLGPWSGLTVSIFLDGVENYFLEDYYNQ